MKPLRFKLLMIILLVLGCLVVLRLTSCNKTEELVQSADTGDYNEIIERTDHPIPVFEPLPYYYLSPTERRTVECLVMGEVGSHTRISQMLVAQCLLNACLKEGKNPSDIRDMYNYTGWSDDPSNEVKSVVYSVFDKGEKLIDENIMFFYASNLVSNPWHESQKFVVEIDNVRYFSPK